MDCTILQFIIVCPMVFLAGFVDAIAGGGGIDFTSGVPDRRVPTHMALGTNKMSSMMGTAIATGGLPKTVTYSLRRWFGLSWRR